MLSIRCEKCNGVLLVDESATISMYLKDDPKYVVDIDTEKLNSESIQDYLVYRCSICTEVFNITYKEWEQRYRMAIANEVMEIRKRHAFKNINPETVSEDNGISFCGQCSGYAGDGYCLNDIIRQCIIRKD